MVIGIVDPTWKREIVVMGKDGRPFDIDIFHGVQPLPEDTEIIQYLINGKRRRMLAEVGVETARMANNLIIESEILKTGEVAIYGRKIGEPEENEIVEIANNGPTKTTTFQDPETKEMKTVIKLDPREALIKIIRRLNA